MQCSQYKNDWKKVRRCFHCNFIKFLSVRFNLPVYICVYNSSSLPLHMRFCHINNNEFYLFSFFLFYFVFVIISLKHFFSLRLKCVVYGTENQRPIITYTHIQRWKNAETHTYRTDFWIVNIILLRSTDNNNQHSLCVFIRTGRKNRMILRKSLSALHSFFFVSIDMCTLLFACNVAKKMCIPYDDDIWGRWWNHEKNAKNKKWRGEEMEKNYNRLWSLTCNLHFIQLFHSHLMTWSILCILYMYYTIDCMHSSFFFPLFSFGLQKKILSLPVSRIIVFLHSNSLILRT